jgi:sugar phosphate isomerase/epimerase
MKGGLQACSVTKEFLEDTYGTLKKMADYGYKYIESAGTMFTPELKVDMKELKKMMDEVGIEHPSKHYCPYLTSDLNSEIERLHIIGGDYLALASDFFTSRDEVLTRCEMYNQTGKICN